MVLTCHNQYFWHYLSKYNLPFYFIELFKYNINWEVLLLYNKFLYKNTFLIKFQRFWITNSKCINVIFNNSVYDEIMISIYPQFIDWKVNIIYNHLSYELLSIYKPFYIKTILQEQFLDFIDICQKNSFIYELCIIDYCKFHNRKYLYKELIEYINSPKFVINWIEKGLDYNGEIFMLN